MVHARADAGGYIVRLTLIELECFACYKIYTFSNCLGCSEACTLLFVVAVFVMRYGCASKKRRPSGKNSLHPLPPSATSRPKVRPRLCSKCKSSASQRIPSPAMALSSHTRPYNSNPRSPKPPPLPLRRNPSAALSKFSVHRILLRQTMWGDKLMLTMQAGCP